MRHFIGLLVWAALSAAPVFSADVPDGYDVYILGEIHDNPDHHALQARVLREISPRAVVFEMLLPEEADRLADAPRATEEIAQRVADFHWPNLADYGEVLAASPVIVGAALPRDTVRAAFAEGAAGVFGAEAALYGLTDPLPADEQDAREAMQFDAHCAAMPRDMMGGMVEAQRLRDAAFARAVLAAVDDYDTPVALITGNGHARLDWGVPAYLAAVRPELSVYSLGQGEGGAAPPGRFSAARADAIPAERDDPCAALRD